VLATTAAPRAVPRDPDRNRLSERWRCRRHNDAVAVLAALSGMNPRFSRLGPPAAVSCPGTGDYGGLLSRENWVSRPGGRTRLGEAEVARELVGRVAHSRAVANLSRNKARWILNLRPATFSFPVPLLRDPQPFLRSSVGYCSRGKGGRFSP